MSLCHGRALARTSPPAKKRRCERNAGARCGSCDETRRPSFAYLGSRATGPSAKMRPQQRGLPLLPTQREQPTRLHSYRPRFDGADEADSSPAPLGCNAAHVVSCTPSRGDAPRAKRAAERCSAAPCRGACKKGATHGLRLDDSAPTLHRRTQRLVIPKVQTSTNGVQRSELKRGRASPAEQSAAGGGAARSDRRHWRTSSTPDGGTGRCLFAHG